MSASEPDHCLRPCGGRLAGVVGACAALIVALCLAPVQAATKVSVAGRDFDPLAQSSARPFGASPEDAHGGGLRLVQWASGPDQSQLDQALGEGAIALQYYPDRAFLIWSDRPALARISGQQGVRWAGDFGAGLKVSPELIGRQGLIDLVSVHFYANGSAQSTLTALAALGGQLVADGPAQPDRRLHNAYLRIDASRLQAIAGLPEVIWLGQESPRPESEDEISALLQVGNPPNGTTPVPGYLNYLNLIGLDGGGVVWGVSDEGVDLSHPDFANRIVAAYSFPGCLPGNGPGDDSAAGGHGTHVAGILGSAGVGGHTDLNGFSYGLGVAPKVGIYAQNVLCRGGNPSFPPAGGWQTLSKRAVEVGAIGTNLSFTTGEGIRHGYQSIERLFDVMVRDGNFDTPTQMDPLTMIFSAGNSGPAISSLTAPKEAKNIIVVGASESPRSGDAGELLPNSSRGPTQDGRLVPTLVAPGGEIASTRRLGGGTLCNLPEIPNTDDLYAYCSGTSMAAPHVSGLAALMVQWWRQRYPGTNPSPAMLKAMLIAGAEDISGAAAAAPNPEEGWGQARLPQMIALDRPPWLLDQTELFGDSGEIHRYGVVPVDPQAPVRVVLSWTDAPGAIGAVPALVNDLDLQLQRGAIQYLGNQTGATGAAQADHRNNSEALTLEPSVEPILIRVSAANLPGDGLPFFGDITDQDYALLCDNCQSIAAFDLDQPVTEQAICAGQDAQFQLPLLQLDPGVGTVDATIQGLPTGLSGNLLPTSLAADGVFQVNISGSAGLSAGSYPFVVDLTAANFSLSQPLRLLLSDGAPGDAALMVPPNSTEVSSLRPLLRWSASSQAQSYRLELSINPDFSAPLLDLTLTQLEYRPSVDLAPETTYYWRITANNACAAGTPGTASFRTPASPGSCPLGTRKMLIFRDLMEPPQSGWALGSQAGVNTWQVSAGRASSPTRSWRATDFSSTTDQALDSPLIMLPAATDRPVLSFRHWRNIERRDAALCWDGAVLDLVTLAGAVQAVDPERFQFGGPQRLMAPSSPAAGRPAWCGLSDFETTYLDLRDVANAPFRARFRMLSDARIGAEGWYVDDVQVHSCVNQDVLFRNGMGAEPN